MHGGIPIPEAAAALGISERTVRRRIKDGDLNAYEIHTVHGPAWRVVLPSRALTTVDKGVDREQVIGALLMEMAQRVEALEALLPEYGPHDPGPPVVLRREEYPSEVIADADPNTDYVVRNTMSSRGFWARLRAWWEGGG